MNVISESVTEKLITVNALRNILEHLFYRTPPPDGFFERNLSLT